MRYANRETWRIGSQRPDDRIMQQITNELRLHSDVPMPSREQIGVVLRALADHTAIMQAMTHAPDDSPWPQATSIGRWFHDYADYMLDDY